MITSKAYFGAAMVLLGLGVAGVLAGLETDKHYWSILGGILFGSGATFLAVEVMNNWGPDEPAK